MPGTHVAELVCQYARQLIDIVEHDDEVREEEYVAPRGGKGIDDVFLYHIEVEREIRHLYVTTDMGTEVIDILGEVGILGELVLGLDAYKKLIAKLDFFLRGQVCAELACK